MLINGLRNAIRINWVNFRKNATLYALKTLILWKKQRYTLLKSYILLKFNAITYKNVRSQKNPSFYALKKLAFAEIQHYTVWKRLGKTIALRFENVSFWKKPSLYALKTLNLKLTLPSLADDTLLRLRVDRWQV